MAQSYSYGHQSESPYATTLLTTYDFSMQQLKTIQSRQRALASQLRVRGHRPTLSHTYMLAVACTHMHTRSQTDRQTDTQRQ
jgi:hypothetical protein